VGFQVALDVLLQGEGHVSVTDPLAQRLPVDLGIASGGSAFASRSNVPPHAGRPVVQGQNDECALKDNRDAPYMRCTAEISHI
jgi:hypothetical protein